MGEAAINLRTYRVMETERKGKPRFLTVAREDGYWASQWYSKRRRDAIRKGDEWVSGLRDITWICWGNPPPKRPTAEERS